MEGHRNLKKEKWVTFCFRYPKICHTTTADQGHRDLANNFLICIYISHIQYPPGKILNICFHRELYFYHLYQCNLAAIEF